MRHLRANAWQSAQRLCSLIVGHVAHAQQPGRAAAGLRPELGRRLHHKLGAVSKPRGAQLLLAGLRQLLQRWERIKSPGLPLVSPVTFVNQGTSRLPDKVASTSAAA